MSYVYVILLISYVYIILTYSSFKTSKLNVYNDTHSLVLSHEIFTRHCKAAMFQTTIGHQHKTYIFKNQIVSKHIINIIVIIYSRCCKYTSYYTHSCCRFYPDFTTHIYHGVFLIIFRSKRHLFDLKHIYIFAFTAIYVTNQCQLTVLVAIHSGTCAIIFDSELPTFYSFTNKDLTLVSISLFNSYALFVIKGDFCNMYVRAFYFT